VIIDHVNTLLSGGSATAARRLHNGLLAAGVDSRLWVGRQPPGVGLGPATREVPWPLPAESLLAAFRDRANTASRAIQLRLIRGYYRRGRRRRSGGFIGVRLAMKTPYTPRAFHGDIVHFHWVGHVVDFPSFFATLPADKPLVWTLHDMNPLTGGCSHAMDCDHFTQACGDCPILARPGRRDLSFQEFDIKRRCLAGRPVRLVAPSHWMADQARRSEFFRSFPVEVIRNPIDLQAFRPQDRRQARERLGLPRDGIGILFAAESVELVGKGIVEYIETLRRVSRTPGLFGITFGRGSIRTDVDGVPIRHLGYLASHDDLRAAYSAADVFVMPSHAETISQTIVEAFACGTPTVAFAVGGIPELVQDGKTGFLAPLGDVAQLADRVQWVIDHPQERLQMGRNGMQLVHAEFTARIQVDRYLDVYRGLSPTTS
jgi:glycosyltransferase involved in cell wall biosynthesis